VVVGANVTAENTATGVKTATLSNGSGVYTVRFLPIGPYTLTVDAKGFSLARVDAFPLEIDQTAKVNVALKISTSTTTEVRETVHPILNTSDATFGNTLSTTEIENIPLNGRNFSSALPCVPNTLNPTGADNGVCAYGVAGQFAFGSAHNSTERAPGYRQVDTSLFKDFHVWREQVVGFRADFSTLSILPVTETRTITSPTAASARSLAYVPRRDRYSSACITCFNPIPGLPDCVSRQTTGRQHRVRSL